MRNLLLRLLSLPVKVMLWPLRKLWHGLGLLGLGLRRLLTAALRFTWGLLLRFFLRPVGNLLQKVIIRPVSAFLRRLWAFTGRCGLALRNLLDKFVWRPIWLLLFPLRFIYWRILHKPLLRLLKLIGRFLGWLFLRPLRALLYRLHLRWETGQVARMRLRRHWRSRLMVWQAQLHLFLTRPQPSRRAIVAPVVTVRRDRPRRQRFTRLATTGVAFGLVVLISTLTAQQTPQINHVVAQSNYQLYSSKFTGQPSPTPAPSLTPTPVASPTPWPTPDPINGGGSVVFSLRTNGNSDIFALSIGQSQPVRLTTHPAHDRDPVWSPDGKQVAFSSQRDGNWEIYVLDLEDGELRRLTNDPAYDAAPSWSPDGQWLVFESYRQNNLDLYLISADGEQGPLRLTQHPAPDFAPVWSPGGRHIAYTSWRDGNKEIYILSLDAAADSAALNVTNTPGGQEDNPAFSPDGSYLAYSDDSSGYELVYVLPLQDYQPIGEPVTRGQGSHPTWSPDGKALSYIHTGSNQSHLIASSLDAWSVAPQAFASDGRLDSPHWSPLTLPVELPERLAEMNKTPADPFFVETVFPPQEEGAPYLLQTVSVNAPAPYLNDRVDQSFVALRQQMVHVAGWDFLGEVANMYEPLHARPLPGLSERSWNKAGRAFDYNSDYAILDTPLVEVVREDRGNEIYWRTYLRAAVQDGSMGEPLRELPWDFQARFGPEPLYYDQGGKYKDAIPEGYYIDFTELAADYGWQRTPASDNWRTYFPGILFWHYEKRQGLSWEQAMLELFTVEELREAFAP